MPGPYGATSNRGIGAAAAAGAKLALTMEFTSFASAPRCGELAYSGSPLLDLARDELHLGRRPLLNGYLFPPPSKAFSRARAPLSRLAIP